MNTVRVANARRTPARLPMAGWKAGANRKANPARSSAAPAARGVSANGTPLLASTSALPERLETERLPCFATPIPSAAIRRAVAVEMLKAFDPSPPVPQVSIKTER